MPGFESGRPIMGPAEAQRIEDEAHAAAARAARTEKAATPPAPTTSRDALIDELRERALDGVACPVCSSTPNGPAIRTTRTRSASPGLWEALAAARAEFQSVKKDRTARIEKEGKQGYEYGYATLDAVLSAIVPALSKHGIALTQPIWQDSNGRTIVSTVLVHGPSGQHVRADFPVPDPAQGEREPLKRVGSSITYARRYTLTSLVAIASEEDDDGHRGEGARGRQEGAESSDAEREGKRIRGKLAGRLRAAFGEGEPWKDRQKVEVVRRCTGKAWAQLEKMPNAELSRLLAERLELTIQDVKDGVPARTWPSSTTTITAPATEAPMSAPADREPGEEG